MSVQHSWILLDSALTHHCTFCTRRRTCRAGPGAVVLLARPLQQRLASSFCCNHSFLFLFTAGAQAEPVLGQWSYSLGPCSGIHCADQLWMSRFILLRLSEHFQLVASLDSKPVSASACREDLLMRPIVRSKLLSISGHDF